MAKAKKRAISLPALQHRDLAADLRSFADQLSAIAGHDFCAQKLDSGLQRMIDRVMTGAAFGEPFLLQQWHALCVHEPGRISDREDVPVSIKAPIQDALRLLARIEVQQTPDDARETLRGLADRLKSVAGDVAPQS